MPHPVALALFSTSSAASDAAGRLHTLGVGRDRISVVARTPAEERDLAEQMDATTGVELEESRPAAILGEIGGQVLAAIALVMPGIGPLVAAGPLAAELGEATGHAAGSLASVLASTGLAEDRAEALQHAVANGAVLLGVHTDAADLDRVTASLSGAGASRIETVTWK